VQFEPTFNKHARTICEGAFMHVTDRIAFQPVFTTVAILQETIRLYPIRFEWKPPPYEYEFDKWPIDILAGNAWLRKEIEELSPLERIREQFEFECNLFDPLRRRVLLY
jgi:uncharacterized protein YbbC (DUF1343 family)